MRCLHCNTPLPLLRRVKHDLFCSAAHHDNFLMEQRKLAFERILGFEAAPSQPAARAEALIFFRANPSDGGSIPPRGMMEPIAGMSRPVLPALDLNWYEAPAYPASQAA